MLRRVVVTGIGAVTAAGLDVQTLWGSVVAGRSHAGPITRFDTNGLPVRIAAEVPANGLVDLLPVPLRIAKRLDRSAQLALISGVQALGDANLRPRPGKRHRLGVYDGSSLGPLAWLLEQHAVLLEKGLRRLTPFTLTAGLVGSSSGAVAHLFGSWGPSLTTSDGSVSSTVAVGLAFDAIRHGYLDAAVAGGTEAPLAPAIIASFARSGVLSTRNDDPEHACRPFDRSRDGFVLGEGAAMLVLEELELARARGATIYGEVLGWGNTTDPYSMTAPNPKGRLCGLAIKQALRDARLPPEAIGLVSAHGTGTPPNDPAEVLALKCALGEHAARVPVASWKPIIGHLLGASGAAEIVVCLLALHTQFVPQTANYTEPDPACDVDVVRSPGRAADIEHVLKISESFGGRSTAIVLGRWNGSTRPQP